MTVLCCAAGAGLALYGITRAWAVEVTTRPGLPDLTTARTGADLAPWVVGLALVALAGGGALLATRGTARRGLGALLALTGAAVVAGAVGGRTGADAGAAGAGGTLWPVVCVLGGLLVVAGGWRALRHGHEWPSMGARYERRPATATPPPANEDERVDTRTAWDALDRGDDPTAP
ncbi:Trp biosynthesis-associated membrane protein [Couchioplanes caeruleus]|uniref:Trp biosynthesis-associated membrane protein n=1 Tax=Couchioplanes caeruleus TaxID=56438 RepID=UPI001FD4B671|nr:Trp biosynthesis-associated membrane protein [Couchioplanes caeruleus]